MRTVFTLMLLVACTAGAQTISSEARRITNSNKTGRVTQEQAPAALYATSAPWRQATNEIARLNLQAKPLRAELAEIDTRIRLKQAARQSVAADRVAREKAAAALKVITRQIAAVEVRKFDAEVAVKKQAAAHK